MKRKLTKKDFDRLMQLALSWIKEWTKFGELLKREYGTENKK